MKKLKYIKHFDDILDVRFIIVSKETGNINYPIIRCVGNFDNYVVLGTLIIKDDFETYVLIGTENIAKTSFTISRGDTDEEYETTYSEEKIKKEIIQRAKDLIFEF